MINDDFQLQMTQKTNSNNIANAKQIPAPVAAAPRKPKIRAIKDGVDILNLDVNKSFDD